jgi:glutathione S-transferase
MAQEADSQADLAAALGRLGGDRTANAGRAWPVLYSFRRCPYAMRARMAIAASGQRCELREVVLRDKPPELIAASPKGTVPVLVDVDGRVIDQSLDIMRWALERNDPEGWLRPERGTLDDMLALVADCELGFKPHLDGYKYPERGPGGDATAHRAAGSEFLARLDGMLQASRCLFGESPALADIAIAPFVRQFAQVDSAWFHAQPWVRLQRWLDARLATPLFARAMEKYPAWRAGTPGVPFPD